MVRFHRADPGSTPGIGIHNFFGLSHAGEEGENSSLDQVFCDIQLEIMRYQTRGYIHNLFVFFRKLRWTQIIIINNSFLVKMKVTREEKSY